MTPIIITCLLFYQRQGNNLGAMAAHWRLHTPTSCSRQEYCTYKAKISDKLFILFRVRNCISIFPSQQMSEPHVQNEIPLASKTFSCPSLHVRVLHFHQFKKMFPSCIEMETNFQCQQSFLPRMSFIRGAVGVISVAGVFPVLSICISVGPQASVNSSFPAVGPLRGAIAAGEEDKRGVLKKHSSICRNADVSPQPRPFCPPGKESGSQLGKHKKISLQCVQTKFSSR